MAFRAFPLPGAHESPPKPPPLRPQRTQNGASGRPRSRSGVAAGWFPGGETLSLAKPGPAIALVPARRDLPIRYARLRRNIQATFGSQIRMTPLPGRLTEALRLVDELAR
jgi:hypothetical protein